jgi:hypothetical protein
VCVIRYLGSFQVDMGSIGVSDLLWAIRGFWVRGNFGFERSRSRCVPSAFRAGRFCDSRSFAAGGDLAGL